MNKLAAVVLLLVIGSTSGYFSNVSNNIVFAHNKYINTGYLRMKN